MDEFVLNMGHGDLTPLAGQLVWTPESAVSSSGITVTSTATLDSTLANTTGSTPSIVEQAASTACTSMTGPANPGHGLVGIKDICPLIVKLSPRAWMRLCDSGCAPRGVKLGGRRLWNLEEVYDWITKGCPRVAKSKVRRV